MNKMLIRKPNPNFGKLPTAQEKMIRVNQRAGNSGIQNQQGSTRILFDSLLIGNAVVGPATFQFFKSPNTQGPIWQTNVDSINGLLGPGETMAAQFISFSVIQLDTATGEITELGTVAAAGPGSLPGAFYSGTWEIDISNNKVVKPSACQVFQPAFNPTHSAVVLENYRLESDLVIMPALPVIVTLRLPNFAITPVEDVAYYLRCTLMGVGSLLNLKQNI